MAEVLTPIRRQILQFIATSLRERNFPPTIREIGEHVNLSSSATVQKHVQVLRSAGYLQQDPQKPRTLKVMLDTDNAPVAHSNSLYLPLVGDVAAGSNVLAQETSHDLMAIPEEFAGNSENFVLQVRGESMIEAGIMPGDFVVVNRQPVANTGEIVVAGIPGEEATVKRFFPQGSRVVLKPENRAMEPMEFAANEVQIYGRVISVLRRY